jgi:FtsZ-interacting cell division protein YlmF
MIVSAKLHAALQEKFNELQAKADGLATDLAAANSTIADHVETISAANGQIETLTAEVDAFKAKAGAVEEKEKAVEEKEKEIDKTADAKAADKAIEIVASTGTPVIDKPAAADAVALGTVEPKTHKEFSDVFNALHEKSPVQAGAYFKAHSKKFLK